MRKNKPDKRIKPKVIVFVLIGLILLGFVLSLLSKARFDSLFANISQAFKGKQVIEVSQTELKNEELLEEQQEGPIIEVIEQPEEVKQPVEEVKEEKKEEIPAPEIKKVENLVIEKKIPIKIVASTTAATSSIAVATTTVNVATTTSFATTTVATTTIAIATTTATSSSTATNPQSPTAPKIVSVEPTEVVYNTDYLIFIRIGNFTSVYKDKIEVFIGDKKIAISKLYTGDIIGVIIYANTLEEGVYDVTVNNDTGETATLEEAITTKRLPTMSDDLTAPRIIDIEYKTKNDCATIIWITNEPSTSQLMYGTDSNLDTLSSFDSSLVTDHSIEICSLEMDQEYLYKVISQDGEGNKTISELGPLILSNTFNIKLVSKGVKYVQIVPGQSATATLGIWGFENNFKDTVTIQQIAFKNTNSLSSQNVKMLSVYIEGEPVAECSNMELINDEVICYTQFDIPGSSYQTLELRGDLSQAITQDAVIITLLVSKTKTIDFIPFSVIASLTAQPVHPLFPK